MTISSKYPSIKPSLLLDFANTKSIDPRIIFSRASTATYFDNTGLMKTAAANVGRINHDPVTGACKGFLIEEQRTNLLTYSEQFDNAAWAKTRSTITANAATAPDGSTAAAMVTTADTGFGYMYQGFSFTSGQAYSVSVYAKAGSENVISIQSFTQSGMCSFTLSGAGSVGASYGIASNPQIQHLGNGWYRCSVVFTASATETNNVSPCSVGSANSTVYIWGAQLEAGAFPTSYIPTTSAQVTRAADSASMTGTNFSSWYNPSEGTLFSEADLAVVAGRVSYIASLNSETSNNFMSFARISGTSGMGRITASGVTQSDCYLGEFASGIPRKTASAYKENSFAASANGGTAVTDSSGTIPTVSTLTIGGFSNDPTLRMNGHIKRLAYYPKRLSDIELQAITS